MEKVSWIDRVKKSSIAHRQGGEKHPAYNRRNEG